jgi:hypothetical protein
MAASSLRKLTPLLVAMSAALLADSAAAQSPREDPAAAKETDFGKTALFDADIPEGLSPEDWNISSLGLFCGTKVIHPGRVVAYVYGIGSDKPLEASFDIDGKITDLTLKPFNDVPLAPLDGDFIRRFLRAKSVSIQLKDYGAPRPDRIKLEHVESRLKSALKKCFKF